MFGKGIAERERGCRKSRSKVVKGKKNKRSRRRREGDERYGGVLQLLVPPPEKKKERKSECKKRAGTTTATLPQQQMTVDVRPGIRMQMRKGVLYKQKVQIIPQRKVPFFLSPAKSRVFNFPQRKVLVIGQTSREEIGWIGLDWIRGGYVKSILSERASEWSFQEIRLFHLLREQISCSFPFSLCCLSTQERQPLQSNGQQSEAR